MEQRWGLPLIAWPARLRPNYWDLVALPMVLGVIALASPILWLFFSPVFRLTEMPAQEQAC